MQVFYISFLHLLIEGNKDGSISVSHPKKAAQVLIMLYSVWINPAIFRVPYQEFCEKLSFAEYFCEKIGVPVVNDEIKDLLIQLYKS